MDDFSSITTPTNAPRGLLLVEITSTFRTSSKILTKTNIFDDYDKLELPMYVNFCLKMAPDLLSKNYFMNIKELYGL